MVMKRLGCSLPFNYLAGEKGTEFETLFGPLDDCLRLFASVGVGSIELRSVTPATSAEDFSRALDCIRKHGLNATIHGALPGLDSLESGFPALSVLPSDIEFIVTIHAYAGEEHSLDAYKEQTVAALKVLLADTKPNIIFAVELNRKRPPRVDPGSTFQGVLEIVEALNDTRVGICWDFGHTLSNAENGFSKMFPTEDFLKRVVHTHIHDISDAGQTHFPLSNGPLPLRECVTLLEKAGYPGRYNFEPGINRWLDTPNEKRSKMLKSLEILNAALTETGISPG